MSYWQQPGEQRPLQKFAADAQYLDTRVSQRGGSGSGSGAPTSSMPRNTSTTSQQYVFSTASASPSPRRQQQQRPLSGATPQSSRSTLLHQQHYTPHGSNTITHRMDHSGLNDSTDAIVAAPISLGTTRRHPQDNNNGDRPSWMTPPTQQQQYLNHTATDDYFNRPSTAGGGGAKLAAPPSSSHHHNLYQSVSGFVTSGPIDMSAVSPVPSSVESFLTLHDRSNNITASTNSRHGNKKNNVAPSYGSGSRREDISRGNSFRGCDQVESIRKTNSINSQLSNSIVSGSWLRRAGSLDGPGGNSNNSNGRVLVEGWVRGPDEDIRLGPGEGDMPANRLLSSPSALSRDPFLQQQDRWGYNNNNISTSNVGRDIVNYSEEDDDEDDTLTGGGLLYSTIIRPVEVKLLKYVLSAPKVEPITTTPQNTPKTSESTPRDPAEIDNKYWADNLQSRLKQEATDVRPLGGIHDGDGAHQPKEEVLGSLFDSMVDYFTKRRFEKSSPSSSLSASKKYRKVGHLKTGGRKPKTIAQRSPLLAVLGEGYVPELGSNLVKLGVSLVVCHLLVAYTLLWVF